MAIATTTIKCVADVEQNYKTVPIEYTVQKTPPLMLRGVVPPTEGHVPNGDIMAPEGGQGPRRRPPQREHPGWIANSQRTHDRLGAWSHLSPTETSPQRRPPVPSQRERNRCPQRRHWCPQRRHSRTVLQQEWMAPNGGQGPMTGMLTTRSRDLDTRSKPLPKPQREIGTARSRLRVTYDHVEYKGGLSPCAERHPLGADLDR